MRYQRHKWIRYEHGFLLSEVGLLPKEKDHVIDILLKKKLKMSNDHSIYNDSLLNIYECLLD